MRRSTRPVITRLARVRASAAWAVKDAVAGVSRRVEEGKVALTFDDGPHPAFTGQILDLLAELRTPATFFCVGKNAREHPDVVRRALAEGHSVGSHSHTHPHPAHTQLRALSREYSGGRDSVAATAGRDITIFRPPHGHLGHGSALMVRRLSLSPWLWTIDPQDWRPGITTDEVIAVAGTARSGDVILLHDRVEQPWGLAALDRSATVHAVPSIVEAVRQRGLDFVPLPM